MESKEITIVGAGLVGSLLSVYMAQKGYRVKVYERRPDMRKQDAAGGRSINLALSDRGWKALSEVGMDDEIREICIPMKGRMMHSESGELTYQPYGQEGQNIYSVSRADLNRRLVEMAEAHEKVAYFFDQKLVKIDLDDEELLFQDQTTQQIYDARPDLVFGTDGAFSRVRYGMQKRNRFDYAQDYLPHGYKELEIPPAEDGGWRLEKNYLHIWPRHSFMMIALPNLDGSFTCTLFAPFEGENSFESIKTEEDVMAYFQKHFPDSIPHMPNLVQDYFDNPTSSLVTIKCWPWTARGKFALLGDASHAIVPFYGQGMNSGFEDCSVLHELMEKHGEDWDVILKEFEASRKPNADAIADLAKQNFIEMRDLVADPMFLLRKKIAGAVSKRHPGKFLPVYGMVTFSHKPYAEALAELHRQDKAFEDILTWPDIAVKWESDYLEKIESLLLS